MLSFFPRDVSDGISNLIESVSENFPIQFYTGYKREEIKFEKDPLEARNTLI